MYNGNHAAPRRDAADSGRSARRFARGASPLLLVLCLVLLVSLAVGGTVAWLNATSEPVTNDMTPGKVPITIEETFDGATKSGVTVKNTGNIDAYIRVAIVANAVDADGNVTAGRAPTVTPTSAWTQVGNYCYYNGTVAPGESTSVLFEGSVDVSNAEINILAESIQVLGGTTGDGTAAQDAWGVSFNGTTWTATA